MEVEVVLTCSKCQPTSLDLEGGREDKTWRSELCYVSPNLGLRLLVAYPPFSLGLTDGGVAKTGILHPKATRQSEGLIRAVISNVNNNAQPSGFELRMALCADGFYPWLCLVSRTLSNRINCICPGNFSSLNMYSCVTQRERRPIHSRH